MNNMELYKNHVSSVLEELKHDGIQKIAVGAVVFKEGKVLLLERSPEDFLGGFVELPGGGVEDHETVIQALIRELSEETGLTATSVDGYVGSFDYTSESGKQTRQFNFTVSVVDAMPRLSEEHVAYTYVLPSQEELDKLNISQKTKQAVLDSTRLV